MSSGAEQGNCNSIYRTFTFDWDLPSLELHADNFMRSISREKQLKIHPSRRHPHEHPWSSQGNIPFLMADLLHGHAQVWLKQSSNFLDDDKLKSFYLFFFCLMVCLLWKKNESRVKISYFHYFCFIKNLIRNNFSYYDVESM